MNGVGIYPHGREYAAYAVVNLALSEMLSVHSIIGRLHVDEMQRACMPLSFCALDKGLGIVGEHLEIGLWQATSEQWRGLLRQTLQDGPTEGLSGGLAYSLEEENAAVVADKMW